MCSSPPRRASSRSPARTSSGWARHYRVAGTDRSLAYKDVVAAALDDTGTLTVKGTWSTPPETQGGKFRGAAVGIERRVLVRGAGRRGRGRRGNRAWSSVERVWVAHDCGFAINPLAVEGQVQGAVWMGMGQALSEETQYHEGLPLRANMLDYRIPTIVESPPIETFIVEAPDPARAVRREGGERRLAARLPAGAHQRDRRRDRHAPDRAAGLARSRARSDLVARRRRERLRPDGRQRRTSRPWEAEMERMAPFTLAAPRDARRGRTAAGRRHRARACSPGEPISLPNLRHGIERRRRCSSISAVSPTSASIDFTTDGTTLGAGVTLSRLAVRCEAHASRCRFWRRGRAHGGRPRRIAASPRSAAISASTRAACSTTRANGGARQRILPEARRRDCHVAPQGNALPRRVLRRSRAGAARAWRRSRDGRNARHAPDSALRAVSRRRRRAPDARTPTNRSPRPRAAHSRGMRIRLSQGARSRRDRFSAGRRGVRASGSATAWSRSFAWR